MWSSYVRIQLGRPDQTLSLVGSGRVVFKFHYTDPTRPHPRTKSVHVEIERTSLRPDKVCGLVGDPREPNVLSGPSVEFGLHRSTRDLRRAFSDRAWMRQTVKIWDMASSSTSRSSPPGPIALTSHRLTYSPQAGVAASNELPAYTWWLIHQLDLLVGNHSPVCSVHWSTNKFLFSI